MHRQVDVREGGLAEDFDAVGHRAEGGVGPAGAWNKGSKVNDVEKVNGGCVAVNTCNDCNLIDSFSQQA